MCCHVESLLVCAEHPGDMRPVHVLWRDLMAASAQDDEPVRFQTAPTPLAVREKAGDYSPAWVSHGLVCGHLPGPLDGLGFPTRHIKVLNAYMCGDLYMNYMYCCIVHGSVS